MDQKLKQIYDMFQKNQCITIDSRNVQPGSVFFALKGEHFDGNKFATDAIESGAAYAVVDDKSYSGRDGYIVVDDVLLTLQKLAGFHRKKLTGKVVGITGSNGKTTTKELIDAVLSEKYHCLATKGNLNNHIGVPLTILSFPPDLEYAIVEMGANHVGEIEKLSAISEPDFGLITNIGKAHLEGFGGYEGVIKAKTELYNNIRNKGGKVFINSTDKLLLNKAEGIKLIGYGGEQDRVRGMVVDEFPYLSIKLIVDDQAEIIYTNLSGSYNLQNILAAASIGNYFEVGLPSIKKAIEHYQPTNNRSQVIKTGNNTIIMDAYNANPTSMELAIRHFSGYPASGKKLILGAMKELGKAADKEHKKIIKLLEKEGLRDVYFIGDEYQVGLDLKYFFANTSELQKFLEENPVKDSTILVKGSRGNQLEKIVEYL